MTYAPSPVVEVTTTTPSFDHLTCVVATLYVEYLAQSLAPVKRGRDEDQHSHLKEVYPKLTDCLRT